MSSQNSLVTLRLSYLMGRGLSVERKTTIPKVDEEWTVSPSKRRPQMVEPNFGPHDL